MCAHATGGRVPGWAGGFSQADNLPAGTAATGISAGTSKGVAAPRPLTPFNIKVCTAVLS